MTIDIEKLIADIDEDGSGEIEYDEFRNLLSSSDWLPINNIFLAKTIVLLQKNNPIYFICNLLFRLL